MTSKALPRQCFWESEILSKQEECSSLCWILSPSKLPSQQDVSFLSLPSLLCSCFFLSSLAPGIHHSWGCPWVLCTQRGGIWEMNSVEGEERSFGLWLQRWWLCDPERVVIQPLWASNCSSLRRENRLLGRTAGCDQYDRRSARRTVWTPSVPSLPPPAAGISPSMEILRLCTTQEAVQEQRVITSRTVGVLPWAE